MACTIRICDTHMNIVLYRRIMSIQRAITRIGIMLFRRNNSMLYLRLLVNMEAATISKKKNNNPR